MPEAIAPSDPPTPEEPTWIPPTVRLNTADVEKLLGGNMPEMDAEVTIKAKVTGQEKGTDRNYDTGEKKPRQDITLEIQSVTSGGMMGGEMEDEMEDEDVLSDAEEEAVLGYKRPKKPMEPAPDVGKLY